VKITKVTIEYSDGTKKSVSGEEASKWEEAVNQVTAFTYAHGYTFPLLDWKDE
jgi:hypothetical protein